MIMNILKQDHPKLIKCILELYCLRNCVLATVRNESLAEGEPRDH